MGKDGRREETEKANVVDSDFCSIYLVDHGVILLFYFCMLDFFTI